jgi:GMP synthase-like glutamine amidotransferase
MPGWQTAAMRALAIVHQPDAGPGVFAEAILERGGVVDLWQIGDGGEAPAEPARYDAVLTFGGAMNTHEHDGHPWLAREKALLGGLLEAGVPLLGACLGTQLLAEAAGGSVRRAREPEIGWLEVELLADGLDDPVLGPLAPGFEAFQWHSYEAVPPPGAVALAHSPASLQAYRIGELAWGIQFHAEVSAGSAERWLDQWHTDPDAVRIGLDAEALRAETRGKIEAWNGLGRALCGRFLDAVERYSGVT